MRISLTPILLASIICWTPPALAQDRDEDATALYRELEAEFRTAYDAWFARWRPAARAEDEAKVAELEKQKPARAFISRFQAAAERFRGTEDAVPFLTWLLAHGRYGVGGAREALEVLIADHVASPGIERVPLSIMFLVTREDFDEGKALGHLARIVARNPSKKVKTKAWFYRGEIIRRTEPDADERKSAILAYEKVLELDGDDYCTKRAKGAIHELRSLQVGMAAPEIEGVDLDGTKFKLSDYRGKVVMLDFWGHW